MNVALFTPKSLPDLSEKARAQHPSLRRYTRKYQKKKRIVRDIWIVNGFIMLCVPPNIVIALALAATFLSFTILDETP